MVGTMGRKGTLVFAALACLALAVTLALPPVALAVTARYETASPAAQKAQVDAQASKTSVWVVTKKVYKSSDVTDTESLSYDPNGLVKKRKSIYKFKGEPKQTLTDTFSYGSKYTLKSGKHAENGGTAKISYKCDSKGRVTKMVSKYSSGYSSDAKYKYNAKGQLTKAQYTLGRNSYTYDKKGRLVKNTEFSEESGKTVYSYEYDKHGFVKRTLQTSGNSKIDVISENTVKSKRLVKRVSTDQDDATSTDTTTFTYKKLSVPKAAAKMVKAQQRCIIEEIQNFCTAHR